MHCNSYFRYIINIFLILFIFIGCFDVQSAELSTFHSHSYGGKILMPIVGEKIPNGKTYLPIIVQFDYEIPLIKKNPRHTLCIHFQPQVNPSFIRRGAKSIEAGLNIALCYKAWLKSNLTLSLGVGSGPHYLGYDSEIQKKGFIFSDNFFANFSQALTHDLWINYELRFRHISNLDLAEPNIGIDNFFIGIGFEKKLSFKKR